MGQVQYTEKLSKASKNLSGLKNELFYSEKIHHQNIPLLVSSRVLRSRNLGQVDIVSITSSRVIEVVEVKSSLQGSHLKYSQYRRLNDTLIFLTAIFNLSGRVKTIK